MEVVRLGLVSYHQALRLQQLYVDRHRSGPAHALLLCEHPPVYTTGIRHQPYSEEMLQRLRLLGADVHRSSRGGLITFHGPGQLVCYPVLHLGSFKKVCWRRIFFFFFFLERLGCSLVAAALLARPVLIQYYISMQFYCFSLKYQPKPILIGISALHFTCFHDLFCSVEC